MKTKKLKLDSLSEKELANKEANEVRGGLPICRCICYCIDYEDRIFNRIEERTFVYNEFIPV